MKYVVSWEAKANSTEESVARSLQVFGKWAPSEGVTYHEFVGRVDGAGGFAVVETNDPALIAKDVAPFTAWFDFEVLPVLEVADFAAIAAQAVAWTESVS